MKTIFANCLFIVITATTVLGAEIRSGETVQGNIALPGAQQPWTFYAAAGDVLRLQMAKETENLRPRMRIYDPSRKVVYDTNEHDGGNSALVSVELSITDGGSFTVLCMDGFYTPLTGKFNLSMMRIRSSPNFGSTPARIPAAGSFEEPIPSVADGVAVSGNIDKTGKQQSWRFDAAAGDVVRLQMAKETENLRPRMRIYSPSCQVVYDTNEHDGGNSALVSAELTIKDSGSYTVLCMDGFYTPLTGKFNLSMTRISSSASRVWR